MLVCDTGPNHRSLLACDSGPTLACDCGPMFTTDSAPNHSIGPIQARWAKGRRDTGAYLSLFLACDSGPKLACDCGAIRACDSDFAGSKLTSYGNRKKRRNSSFDRLQCHYVTKSSKRNRTFGVSHGLLSELYFRVWASTKSELFDSYFQILYVWNPTCFCIMINVRDELTQFKQ